MRSLARISLIASLLGGSALAQTAANYTAACLNIETLLGSDSVAYPGSTQYNARIAHFALSSSQPSACAVLPGTAEDVGRVLQVVAETDVPFAIKSGGHAFNPNFSSTPGVLIALSRFNETVYHPESSTATIGAGQAWDPVYATLELYNMTVAGGRVPGVGVGGFVAGGGYSFISDEVGLSVDTIVAYELVLSNGTVVNVTASSDSQLFWALKGGGNNFGVITRLTLNTFPKGLVWGGVANIAAEYLNRTMAAFANWDANVTDPKAVMLLSFYSIPGQPDLVSTVTLFYGEATPPPGLFDEVLSIPKLDSNISTRRLSAVVGSQASPDISQVQEEHIPVNKFPLEVIQAWVAELQTVATSLENTSVFAVGTVLEHFHRDVLTHAAPLDGFSTPSAWPPTRDFPTFPNGLFTAYEDPADSDAVAELVVGAGNRIRAIAAAAGVTETAPGAPDAAKYSNYAHYSSTPEEIYGSALPKLKGLQKVYDSAGLMKRTGGFKFE